MTISANCFEYFQNRNNFLQNPDILTQCGTTGQNTVLLVQNYLRELGFTDLRWNGKIPGITVLKSESITDATIRKIQEAFARNEKEFLGWKPVVHTHIQGENLEIRLDPIQLPRNPDFSVLYYVIERLTDFSFLCLLTNQRYR